MSWPLAFVLSIFIVALLLGISAWKMLSVPSDTVYQGAEGAKGVVREIRDAFVEVAKVQPRIVVHERVFFDQASDISELATAVRTFQVERESQHSWFGSTKIIRLRGVFEGKAGYDLKQPFVVYVEQSPGRKIRLQLPRPKILSIDEKDVEVMKANDGFWNKVQPADVADQTNLLVEAARRQAEQSNLLQEAEESLLRQLRERFGNDIQIEVIPQPTPLP